MLAQEPSFTMAQIGPDLLLDNPNDLNYGPDGFLYVSERERGRIVRVDPATGLLEVVLSVPDNFSSSRQEGLMGFDFYSDAGGVDYLYATYTKREDGSNRQRIVRYTRSEEGDSPVYIHQVVILDSLPSSNDHNSARLLVGPDEKLYLSIGDQGANHLGNYCVPNRAQILPTQAEVDARDYSNYAGSTLRINLDGSIPEDNPVLEGLRSHVFSYGHRNAQGLSFAASGALYSSEHGQNTDDEINRITAGNNYGWPLVVGFQDDMGYTYCNWAALSNCEELEFSVPDCPADSVEFAESSLTAENYTDPLASLFAVGNDYDFDDPVCESSYWCRPNIAPPSIEVYNSDAIPEWTGSLLVPSLKRGRVYQLKLNEAGTEVVGDTTELFYTPNRYRDIAIHPNGKTFYLLTDESGNVSDRSGLRRATDNRRNPATILSFTLNESSSSQDLPRGAFSIAPHPASDELRIEVRDASLRSVAAKLLDAAGRVVLHTTLEDQTTTALDVSTLAGGVYLLRLRADDRLYTQRVLITP